MRRLALIVAYAALLAGSVFAYAAVTNRGRQYYVHQSQAVQLKGHVGGLYPGASKRLRVRIINNSKQRVVVKNLRVQVRTAGPGCSGSNLKPGPSTGSAKVAPRKVGGLTLSVRMRAGAPDACQGQKFKLRYHASYRWS